MFSLPPIGNVIVTVVTAVIISTFSSIWGVEGGNEDPNDVNKNNKIISPTISPAVRMSDSSFGIPLPLDQIFHQISLLPADDMNPEECTGMSDLAEYDMCLTPNQMAQFEALKSPGPGRRRRRQASASGFSLWNDGVIPYVFNSSFASTDRDAIINAMSEWEKWTCVRFRPANVEDRDVVIFRDGKRCSTNIGRIGREQTVTLAKSCLSKRILIHELGHVIGLIHEHQRYDRDKYVRVMMDNIRNMTQERYQFSKLLTGSMTDKTVKYDYTSVMHYGKNYFARSPELITLQPIDARYKDIIGRAEKPSHGDLETVNRLYKCAAGCPASLRCGPTCYMDSICVCRCRNGADKPFFHGPGPFGNSLPDATCEFFASQGECRGNIKDTVRPLCAKSCGLYQPKGNAPPDTTQLAASTSITNSRTSNPNWSPPSGQNVAVNSLQQEKLPQPPPEPFWNSNLNPANSLNSLNSMTNANGIVNDNNLYNAAATAVNGPTVRDVASGFRSVNDNVKPPPAVPQPPSLLSRAADTSFRQDPQYLQLAENLNQGRLLGPSSSRGQADQGQSVLGVRSSSMMSRQPRLSTSPDRYGLVMSRPTNRRMTRVLLPSINVRNGGMSGRRLGVQRLNYIQRKNTPRGANYISASELDVLLNSDKLSRLSNSINQSPPWMNLPDNFQQRRLKQQEQQQQQQQQQLQQQQQQQRSVLGNGFTRDPVRSSAGSNWNTLRPGGNINGYDLGVFNPSTLSSDSSWLYRNRDRGLNFNNRLSVESVAAAKKQQQQTSSSFPFARITNRGQPTRTVEEWQKSLNAGKTDPLVSVQDKSIRNMPMKPLIGPEFGQVESIQTANMNVDVMPDPSINFGQSIQTNGPSFPKPGASPSQNSPQMKTKTSSLNQQGVQSKHWEFQHQQQPMPTVMVDQPLAMQSPPGERFAFPTVTSQTVNNPVGNMRFRESPSPPQIPNLPRSARQRSRSQSFSEAPRNSNRRVILASPHRPVFNSRIQNSRDRQVFRDQEVPIDQMAQMISNTRPARRPAGYRTQRNGPASRQSQPFSALSARLNNFQAFTDPFASGMLDPLNTAEGKVDASNNNNNNNHNDNNGGNTLNNNNNNGDVTASQSTNTEMVFASPLISHQGDITKNNPSLPRNNSLIDFLLPSLRKNGENRNFTNVASSNIRSTAEFPSNRNVNTGGGNNNANVNMAANTRNNGVLSTQTFFPNTARVLSIFNVPSPLRMISSARYLSMNPSSRQNTSPFFARQNFPAISSNSNVSPHQNPQQLQNGGQQQRQRQQQQQRQQRRTSQTPQHQYPDPSFPHRNFLEMNNNSGNSTLVDFNGRSSLFTWHITSTQNPRIQI